MPAEVEQLREQVQVWRRTRKVGTPTPAAIWDAAVPLALEFGVCRIGRAIGLDYTWLRKKVAKAKEQGRPSTPTFVELPGGLVAPNAQVTLEAGREPAPWWPMASGPLIEVSTPSGARMRICMEPGKVVDVAGIVASFLGRER